MDEATNSRAISRRTLLISSSALAGCSTQLNPIRPKTVTKQAFVLVHGTWHGGWVWRDTKRVLEARGHRVIAPTCTGCGDRNHLIAPDTNLTTHVEDVVQAIEFEEIERFVLVGHSFAGLTITGVADRMRSRVEHIIFFDALVPRPGRMAAVSRDPNSGELPDYWQKMTASFEDGYKMPFWDTYSLDMLVPSHEVVARDRLRRLITTHPAGQWTEELVLNNGGYEELARSYIHCVGQAYNPSSDLMIGPARQEGWGFVEFDAPRNAMMTNPEESADLLEQLT